MVAGEVEHVGSGPVRVRVDDATNVVVIHAALNAITVVYGGVETLQSSWPNLAPERRATLLSMAEVQAAHAAQLLRDSQETPSTIHLGVPDRRGEPPYFVMLRHTVTELEMIRVGVLSMRADAPELATSDLAVLVRSVRKLEVLSGELHQLMRRISVGLANTLDELRL